MCRRRTRRSSIPGRLHRFSLLAALLRDIRLSLLFIRTHRFPLSFRFSPSVSCCNSLRTMASADSCQFSVASRLRLQVFFSCMPSRSPQIRTSSFRPRPLEFTAPALSGFGFRHVVVTHPTGTASNPVRVPWPVLLPPASFRFHLTMDTLALG
ncbi:hypothetical protein D3C81_1751160 [compost metagenome]